jgi:hypothetical protein
MAEFNNRISAQRKVLDLVNSRIAREELFGLSAKAIDRWVLVNQLDHDSPLVQLIRITSDKLFFLANKSQEQITEEYDTVSHEITQLYSRIKESMNL